MKVESLVQNQSVLGHSLDIFQTFWNLNLDSLHKLFQTVPNGEELISQRLTKVYLLDIVWKKWTFYVAWYENGPYKSEG